MCDSQISFLYKAASALGHAQQINKHVTLLRSYYLMRCREVTKGYGLPAKQFGAKIRCSHCCLEWKRGTQVKVKALKLSKKQKRKIKFLIDKKNHGDPEIQSKIKLLQSNEMEQTCTFCKQTTTSTILKPQKPKLSINENNSNKVKETPKPTKSSKKRPLETKEDGPKKKQKVEANVYTKTHEVFSLNNKNNTLPSAVKEAKVIKNNKKKKDKFAGLCQKAVLASAMMKEEKLKQNKLNLFLKPSNG